MKRESEDDLKREEMQCKCLENNRYSAGPQYIECEMWLEIGTCELRVLNSKYEQVAVHKRKYAREVSL